MPINPYLGTLFGYGSDSGGMTGSDRIGLYNKTLKNEAKDTERLSKDASIKRDLERLQKAISSAKTPADLLKDPTARKVLLQAYGLAGQEDNVALATKALTSDTTVTGNLASQLTNAAWKTAAQSLDFAKSGLTKLKDPTVFAEIKANFIEYQRVSEVADQSTEVSDALHIRSMEDKTPGVYNVLGDRILRRVALTLAGLPDEIAYQSIESQARQVEKRIDLKEFSTAEGREKLINRYLIISGNTGFSYMA
ncbi:DUF1217 domain-containing protein [Roseomonas sp. 18066]|uniref:DUF1217 domain-containing protein n=1 Tax=Roseomonas sp. 18066 TaxID=2681412 RepID=UPI0013573102|nr:DUF1217 domain-containing protein [Roseomonas sp. 18066]